VEWNRPLVSELFDTDSHPDLSAAIDRARQRRAEEAARQQKVERRAREIERVEARKRAHFDAVVKPFLVGISGITDSPYELAGPGYWCLHHEAEHVGVNLLQGLVGFLQFGPKGARLADHYYEHHVEILVAGDSEDDAPWKFACAKVENESEGGLTPTWRDLEPLSLDALRCSHDRRVHCTNVKWLADALAEILSFHDREFS
jgi:hypothetical protein